MSNTLTQATFGIDGTVAEGSSVVVRDLLVRSAMALFRERAFHEVSLAAVVAHSGVAAAAAAAEFPAWEDLVFATIHAWNAERMIPLRHVADRYGAVALLRAVAAGNVQDPGLMRLLATMTPIAGTPGHPMAPVLQRQWIQFHAMVQRALAHDIEIGLEPATMDPARGAEQLIAIYEGLQAQSMVRPHMDVIEAYDRAVTRLRDGWSIEYHRPIWSL